MDDVATKSVIFRKKRIIAVICLIVLISIMGIICFVGINHFDLNVFVKQNAAHQEVNNGESNSHNVIGTSGIDINRSSINLPRSSHDDDLTPAKGVGMQMAGRQYDNLVDTLSNSVVHVKGTYLVDTDDHQRFAILTAFGGEVMPAKKIKQQAICSGFFVSEDGYIVTNHHCVDDVQGIDIEMRNGSKYNAKVIGYYEAADLAVLKVNSTENEKFPSVKIGNSDKISVGDGIIVIGGPLGYKWSASTGIISGKARDVEYGQHDGPKKHIWGTAGEYIQVDAAINGGNSGGPVFNVNGEVIGVASSGYQFLQGMNFIVASNTLKEFLPAMEDGKIISKGLFGIQVNELEPYDVKAIGMKKNVGVLIHEVVEGSPAEQSGIRRGDVIISINGKEVKDKVSLRNINNDIFANSINEVVVNRYGAIKTFKVKAENVKMMEKLEKGEIGIQEWSDGNLFYRFLTKEKHSKFLFPKDVAGIIVTDIKDNSDPMLTVAVGDVIMQVNDMVVKSIEDYQNIIKVLKRQKKNMAMFHVYKPTQKAIIVKGSRIY